VSNYRTDDVAVRGGTLRVGSWHSDGVEPGRAEMVVLAVHGITSSHRTWPLVAARLTRRPGVLILAPDLRGRGRSAGLPGPWGMDQHAEDVAAVLEQLAPGVPAVVAGHSMGGFVAVSLAAARPELVKSLVLVDGGVPLTLPPGWTPDDAVVAGLGPAAERLSMTFADRAGYREFWREHPAFTGEFSETIAEYVDYDLDPAGPPWRSSCLVEAMQADLGQQFAGGPIERAWQRLRAPAVLLRAPRGLQDEPGGLYQPAALDDWQAQHPDFHWQNVEHVNHYTITLGDTGAARVSATIAGQLDLQEQVIPQAG
jgi:lipase